MKNILSKAGTFDALFGKFRSYLDGKGLSFNEGKIIDASFVEAPRQAAQHPWGEFRYVQINKYQPQFFASMG